MCVLFWPKARKILATAAITTMIFFSFFLLQECCLRGKSNKMLKDCCFLLLTFKAATKIKDDNGRSLTAGRPHSVVGLNGGSENQITVWGSYLSAAFTKG